LNRIYYFYHSTNELRDCYRCDFCCSSFFTHPLTIGLSIRVVLRSCSSKKNEPKKRR